MRQTEPTENSRGLASSSPSQSAQPSSSTPTVQFDVSNLQSSYANVCNVSSTREEVVLAFGVNNVWERRQTNVQVQLTNRIVLNPHTAKRLAALLSRVVNEYESRFGTLHDETNLPTKAA